MAAPPDVRDAVLERDAERARFDAAMQQCEQLARELLVARARQARTQDELIRARETIDNMERSWFWRARLFWVRIRKRLGGRGD